MTPTSSRWLALCCLVAICREPAASAQPAELILIDGAAAGIGVSAQDVTPDGTTVVGTSNGRVFRWTEGGAVEFLSPSDWFYTIDASVSDDGGVVVSTLVNPQDNIVSAARWTQGLGWTYLGCLPGVPPTPEQPAQCSTAFDVSGDGSIVVGLAWHGDTFRAEAFRWTEATGMTGLGQPTDLSSRDTVIAGDGGISGGFYEKVPSAERQPARWSGAGPVDLFLGPYNIGEVGGISSDGEWLTGSALLVDENGFPVPPWVFQKGFLYSGATGFQYVLPTVDFDLGTENQAMGNGVADDGMVVGWSGNMGPFGLVVPGLYCPGAERMSDLSQVIAATGATIPANIALASAQAVTPDGLTVVGQAIDYDTFNYVPFVVRFAAPPCVPVVPSVLEVPALDGVGLLALALAIAGAAWARLRRTAAFRA